MIKRAVVYFLACLIGTALGVYLALLFQPTSPTDMASKSHPNMKCYYQLTVLP